MNLVIDYYLVSTHESETNRKAFGALGLFLCIYVAIKLKKRRQLRLYKVRPINRNRRKTGNYRYYKDMKLKDSSQFFKYTCMTVSMFDKLLKKVSSKITKQTRSDGICPEQRLVITLQ
ncbi:hypothetical protein ABEB36_000011 [Hypothenemus hampei]|uniref:Uncharacterized protein n=1 Tax=Hypothenemus hampei TaxID=57062 RepID=A0ABD1F9Z1_HYPHA